MKRERRGKRENAREREEETSPTFLGEKKNKTKQKFAAYPL